jgi:hypothetical protein
MDKKRVRPSRSSRQVIEMAAPNVRPCAVCHEDRPIVAHGVCDRCRKRQERADNRLLYTPASAVGPQTGYENLAALHKIMNKCKVSGEAKRVMLKAFLPFSALSQTEQAAHMEGLCKADEAGSDEDWGVHGGSSLAPDDSVGREPEV